MKILVDTNRIIAALVRNGTTREILFDKNFLFATPDFTLGDIAEISDDEFDILNQRS